MLNSTNKRIIILFIGIIFTSLQASSPIHLHPENPHYFEYKGEPTLLITSAEHYGAVLNLDFDYKTYLKTLHDEGMNYTRIFTGSYVEIPGSFGIENNTLAPATGRYIAPWKRTDESGKFEGENKFDLNQWDKAYFKRLKKFIKVADKYDIIVEVTFFSSTYQDTYYERNPFHPENNINNLPEGADRKKINTTQNGKVMVYQKNMVEKIVSELNHFDNIFFEIQNEPWADNSGKGELNVLKTVDPKTSGWFKWVENATQISLEWQKAIAQTIVDTEKKLKKKHLIAQNYVNFKYALETVDPNISILNFHYAWPEAVQMNHGWDRPVCFDESGFSNASDTTYLRQAWQFILAGGALFNNLDYSFFPGKEDGTGVNNAPGGGSTVLRNQLAYLHDFMDSFDFVKMEPDCDVVYHAPGLEWNAVSEKGKQYAIVFYGQSQKWIKLNLLKGEYTYETVCPFKGETIDKGLIEIDKDNLIKISCPANKMFAIRIIKK